MRAGSSKSPVRSLVHSQTTRKGAAAVSQGSLWSAGGTRRPADSKNPKNVSASGSGLAAGGGSADTPAADSIRDYPEGRAAGEARGRLAYAQKGRQSKRMLHLNEWSRPPKQEDWQRSVGYRQGFTAGLSQGWDKAAAEARRSQKNASRSNAVGKGGPSNATGYA